MIQIFGVERKTLETCHTEVIESLIEEAEKDPEMARMVAARLAFDFPHSPEGEMRWLDPRVRAWGRQLFERIPHMLYYLFPDPRAGALSLLAASFRHPEQIASVSDEDQMQSEVTELLLPVYVEHLVAAAVFAEEMADDWKPMVGKFVDQMDEPLDQAVSNAVEASLTLGGSSHGD